MRDVASLLPTRLCLGCHRDLPLDRFPPRRVGAAVRRGKCRQCLASYMRSYRAARRRKALGRVTAALARAERPSQAETLVADAFRRFGGASAFITELVGQYTAARHKNPGGRQAMNVLLALARLMELAEASRPKRDLGLLSDEDLQRQQEEAVLRMIAARPELALWAARKLDFLVVPSQTMFSQEADATASSARDLMATA